MQERLEEGGSGAGEEAVRDFYSWDDKGQSQHGASGARIARTYLRDVVRGNGTEFQELEHWRRRRGRRGNSLKYTDQ